MSKIDKKRVALAERLARMELLLAKVRADLEGTSLRRNEVVAKCADACRKQLDSASLGLFAGNSYDAAACCDIASLYLIFARQMLDSDAIEDVLGGNPLQLAAPEESGDEVRKSLSALRNQIMSFRQELRQQRGLN